MLVNDLGIRERLFVLLGAALAVLAALVPVALGTVSFEIVRYLRRYLNKTVRYWAVVNFLNMVLDGLSYASIAAALGSGIAGILIIFGRKALLRLIKRYGVRKAAYV